MKPKILKLLPGLTKKSFSSLLLAIVLVQAFEEDTPARYQNRSPVPFFFIDHIYHRKF